MPGSQVPAYGLFPLKPPGAVGCVSLRAEVGHKLSGGGRKPREPICERSKTVCVLILHQNLLVHKPTEVAVQSQKGEECVYHSFLGKAHLHSCSMLVVLFQEEKLFGGLAHLSPNTNHLDFCLCVESQGCSLRSFCHMPERVLVIVNTVADAIGWLIHHPTASFSLAFLPLPPYLPLFLSLPSSPTFQC